jgi:hypothetical protein
MNKQTLNFCVLSVLLLAAGCGTSSRSISDSGAVRPRQASREYAYAGNPNPELREFDVLGFEQRQAVSEEEIARAAAGAHHVALKKGGSILLIQSGAVYPDGAMVNELSRDFNVVPFSGVASTARLEDPAAANMIGVFRTRENPNYSRLLRLAAAKAGADTVVCYWGILESADEHLATKTVSWLPFVNWVVPDERLHMRIRVKVAVVDVATGNWTILTPKPFEDRTFTVSPRREVNDRKQIETLKTKAYAAGAKEIVQLAAN